MKTLTMFRAAALFAGASLFLASCGRDVNPLAVAPDSRADASASSNTITLPFDPANFSNPQANPYFPMSRGTLWTYHSTSKKGGPETNIVEVTRRTETILGVATTVVHDVVYLQDGSIAEDTFDWYAADDQGNVWYFGEDTKTYDHGKLLGTEGSWRAGQNGARPGIIFLAHPQVGDQYLQEDSPGVVADMARIISLDETVTVNGVTYTQVIETTEWTPIEPGHRAHKFYAPGAGTVLETSTREGGERVELVSISPPRARS